MNALDISLMRFGSIGSELPLNGMNGSPNHNYDNYEHLSSNIDHNLWYSSTSLPLTDCQYIDSTNCGQLLESSIHKWREDCDQSIVRHELKPQHYLRHESRTDSKDSFKRSHYYYSNESEDCERRKRTRVCDSYNSSNHSNKELKRRCFGLNSSEAVFECKSCRSHSYSFRDFKNHLNGKRHSINLRSFNTSSGVFVSNSLQTNLDQTKEPVIGLDFIKEVINDIHYNEKRFDCQLCDCYNLSNFSTFEHILGYKHRFNFIKFVDSSELKKCHLDERPHCHKETELTRALAKKYEKLYGRGNCQFIQIDYKLRNSENNCRNTSCERSGKYEHKSVSSKSPTKCLAKNEYNFKLKNEKAIETIKLIGELCENTIKFHSMKRHLTKNASTQTSCHFESMTPRNGLIATNAGINDHNSRKRLHVFTQMSSEVDSDIDSNKLLEVNKELFSSNN